VAKVEKTTERPQNTENELVTLVKQAKAAGVQPHILRLSCDDYKSMLGADGQVDFEKLLGLLTTLLHKKIAGIATARSAAANQAGGAAEKDAAASPAAAPAATAAPATAPTGSAASPPGAAPPGAPPASPATSTTPVVPVAGDRLILVYGGGLHNDLLPRTELAAYTFGPQVRDEQAGRYLEVDLYVPEYIERDPNMNKEPWFQLYKKRVRPGQTVVIRRMQGSYIIVFPRRRG
jgi:hypothetical protein